VIGNGRDIFCVSNAHCIARYFEELTAIFRHILIICYLKARVGQNQRVKTLQNHRSFSSDVTAAILVYQNNEMAAIYIGVRYGN
jgi:hypothetical protein